jgi:HJR/Mrr/RecB family endonuclease
MENELVMSRYYDAKNKYQKIVMDFKEQRIKQFKNYWLALDGIAFENELAKLFKQMGFTAKLTPPSGDRGIDIILTRGYETIVVQCKAHKNPVGPAVVRDLYGAMVHTKANKAILASTTGFTKGVYEFASDKPIRLLSLDDIVIMSKTLSLD